MGLLFIFIAMVAGILLSGVTITVPVYAYICMAVLVLFSIICVRNKYIWLLLVSTWSLMLGIGLSSPPSIQCADDVIAYAGKHKITVTGWIVKSVVEYPDRKNIVLKVDKLDKSYSETSACLMQLLAFDKDNDLKHYYRGDYIRVNVNPRKPKNFKNPGSFDYKGSLAKKGIGLIAYTNKKEDITVEPAMTQSGVLRLIDAARLHIKDVIAKNTSDQTVFSIVSALVIGDQGYISQDVRKMFASTGIIHILVVAGLHLAIITHLFYLLIKFILSRSKYLCLHTNIPKFSLVSSMLPMFAYIFLSGANPPVVRSGIMIAVYCFLFVINKTKARWTGLLIAAILILTINPMSIYSISFQLSFIAVSSIVAFMPAIMSITSAVILRFENRSVRVIVSWLLGMLLVSFFVTIGLSGIIAFYFNTLPLFGIMLNIIVIPFFCYLVLPLSLASSITGLILPNLSHYLFFIVSLLVHVIVSVVHYAANLSISSIRVPTPAIYELLLYYAFIIALLNVKKMGVKTALLIVSAFLLLFSIDIGYFIYTTHFNNTLRITFIDVGQGDSTFIEFPYGKTMLIDGGGGAYRRYDTGEAVVARYIWSLKRNNVDYVVSSHPQVDHMGGLCFIVKNMGVKKIYKSDCEPDTVVYKNFINAIHGSKAFISTIKNVPETLLINGVKIELFSAPHEACDPLSQKDVNNYAVLTKITYKNVSVLLTGDIEKDAEMSIVGAYQFSLKSDIMKAAHHGSKTSNTEEFIDTVNPKIVVIPVGENNPFHMPSKIVLKRLFEKNIRIFRTDRDGAITITTDGKYIKINRYIDS